MRRMANWAAFCLIDLAEAVLYNLEEAPHHIWRTPRRSLTDQPSSETGVGGRPEPW